MAPGARTTWMITGVAAAVFAYWLLGPLGAAAVFVLALLPAWLAQRKGRDFVAWWIFGVLLWIAALPAAVLVRDVSPRCARCGEKVSERARICRHCGYEIPTSEPPRDYSASEPRRDYMAERRARLKGEAE